MPHSRYHGRVAWSLLSLALLGALLVARAGGKQDGVLVRNRAFGERFLAREDPYFDPERGHRIHGPYPPSLVWFAAPLALVPEPVARIGWSVAQVGALALCALLLKRRAGQLERARELPRRSPPGTPRWRSAASRAVPWAFALGLLATSRFVLRDTAGGGGNLLTASLALLGLELALDGRSRLAGLPLGLALAVKPNLAPLLLYFAARRRGATIATTLATVLLLVALPGLWFGPRAWFELGERWARDVASYAALADLHDPAAVPEGLPEPRNGMNQSLREAVFRAVRPPGETGAADVSWTTLGVPTAAVLGRVLAAILVVLALVRTLRLPRDAERSAPRAAWFAALAWLPLALLLSPITWKAHSAALLPLTAALALVALMDRRERRWLGPVLIAYYLACNLANEQLLGRSSKHWLQSASVVTWGTLVLFAATLRLAAVPRSEPGPNGAYRASQAS